MKKHDLYGYLIGIGLAELIGVLASLFSGAGRGFYTEVEQPPLSPPGWVFPVVWTVLYALMGAASYRVWESGAENRTAALVFYVLQLAVNFVWPIVFFRFQNFGAAAAVLVLLLVLVLFTTVQFFKADRLAGILLLPYVLWTAFALYLNLGVWVLCS